MPAGRPSRPVTSAVFDAAVAELRATAVRAEVTLSELPAPQRLAPFAHAIGAEVAAGDLDLATGRLVLLHDPAEPEQWGGALRIVAYVRADLEHEIATDPFLGGVGWSWLLEALDSRGAAHGHIGGTVTRAASESFGAMAERVASAEVEVRASWTPLDAGLAPHLLAWCDLLCQAGGLAPEAPGVAPIPPPRLRAPR